MAILHVFVAQFAVGGGFLLLWFEWLNRGGDRPLLGRFISGYFKWLALMVPTGLATVAWQVRRDGAAPLRGMALGAIVASQAACRAIRSGPGTGVASHGDRGKPTATSEPAIGLRRSIRGHATPAPASCSARSARLPPRIVSTTRSVSCLRRFGATSRRNGRNRASSESPDRLLAAAAAGAAHIATTDTAAGAWAAVAAAGLGLTCAAWLPLALRRGSPTTTAWIASAGTVVTLAGVAIVRESTRGGPPSAPSEAVQRGQGLTAFLVFAALITAVLVVALRGVARDLRREREA